MNTNSVGLIGVGLLGSGLANRLIDRGLRIHGFDSNKKQLDALIQCGGIACDSAAEVVKTCDVVFFALPTSDVVNSLIRQLRNDLKSSTIIIDTTTGDPQKMIAIGQSLAELGVSYLEATVAGSSVQVTAGEDLLLPCTLPVNAPTVDRPMLLTAVGLEIPRPSRTSVVGFATVWLLVGGIIGAFVWAVS